MSETAFATLLFTAVGVLFIALGIPLLLGRVAPNAWYGCRTEKTLSDKKIWYAVNRVTGRDMVLIGIVVVVSSLLMFTFKSRLHPDWFTAILLSVLLLSVAGMALHSYKVSRRL